MAKRVTVTDQIKAKMQSVVGDGTDVSNFAVFEAVAINSLPVRKPGSLFNGSVMAMSTLQQMEHFLNEEDSVPLLTMHDGSMLPVGRLFSGELVDNGGVQELHVLFFVDPTTEPELAQKVDTGVIDEVSIGMKPKQLLCSECGFDYLGEDAGFENLFGQVCDEGHVIGKDGVHVNVVGMDRWYELSLVTRGAGRNAKILGRTKQVLGAEEHQRLAASGLVPEAVVLFASATPKEQNMDLTTLVASLTDAKADLILKAKEIKDLMDSIKVLHGTIAEYETKITDLEARLAATGDAAAAVAELATVKGALDEAVKFLAEQANKASIAATGAALSELPKTAKDAIALIQASQTNLMNLIPPGGRSAGTGNDADAGPDKARLSAFKTNR